MAIAFRTVMIKLQLWHWVALVVWLGLVIWLVQHLAVEFLDRRVDPIYYAKFQSAQQAFDTAQSPSDFLQAAALYQEILDAGVRSGVVLYNQGNAFMRGGRRGRAVACYLQARRYRPRDPYLDANLRYALGDNTQLAASKPIVEHLMFWLDWVSYQGKFELATGAGLLALLMAATGLFWRKRLIQYLAAAVLVVTVAVALSAVYDWYRFSYLRHGVVIQDATVARKGNAEGYEAAFTQPLSEATPFELIEERGNWLRIRLPGSQEGWIPRSAAVLF